MNKYFRRGVKLDIAFKTGLRKNSWLMLTNGNKVVARAPWLERLAAVIVKCLLWPVRSVYRLLKPTIRWFAMRVRCYLTDGLLQEVQKVSQEVQKVSHQLYGLSQCVSRLPVNCGSGELLIRTEIGALICPGSDHLLISNLAHYGELESGTRIVMQKFLEPGHVYVDVGAHIGIHTLVAARAMRGRGKIIAFEPFEPTKRMLEKSVWVNGFSDIIEIHQAAVSNITGQQELFTSATNHHHSLFELGPLYRGHAQESIEVPLLRLDGVIEADQPIDLIKIDVGGAELEVLEGGASLIAANPEIALIVEFNLSHLRHVGHSISQWFGAFNRLGLDYQVINRQTGSLEKWSISEIKRVELVNLFFARSQAMVWERMA